ncbi:hypothetical protein LUF19_004174 [Escherichia coli]|nr:hypothetical protein [Escherichia coli]
MSRRVSRRSKKRSPATSLTGKETGGFPPVSVRINAPADIFYTPKTTQNIPKTTQIKPQLIHTIID